MSCCLVVSCSPLLLHGESGADGEGMISSCPQQALGRADLLACMRGKLPLQAECPAAVQMHEFRRVCCKQCCPVLCEDAARHACA